MKQMWRAARLWVLLLFAFLCVFPMMSLAEAPSDNAADYTVTITNKIVGDRPNITKVGYTFTLDDSTYNKRVDSKHSFKSGVLTFELGNDDSILLKNLPADVTYTLSTEAIGGYNCSIDGQPALESSGILKAGKDLTLDCVVETVTDGPDFVYQPEDASVMVGEYAELVAEVEGGYGTLTYQWQRCPKGGTKWTKVRNAAEDYLSIDSVDSADNGASYRCLVRDALGRTATSDVALITIPDASIVVSNTIINEIENRNPKPLKSNQYVLTLSDDTFNEKIGGVRFYEGVAAFNVKDGQSLALDGLPAGATFTLQQKKTNGFTTTIDNAKGEPVASASAKGTLTAGGSFKVHYTNTIDDDPIVTDPHNVSARLGSYAVFSVAGSGVQPLQYQWQVSADGGNHWDNIPGANKRTYTRFNVRYSKPKLRFRCICSDVFGRTVISDSCQLLVFEDDQYLGNSPSTGDQTPLALLIGGAALSLVLAVAIILIIRKRSKVHE